MRTNKLTKNFSRSEFACKCGCSKNDIDIELVKMLQQARDILGEPIWINSGIRCKKHNKVVGGKSNSSHLIGLAADIKLPGPLDRLSFHHALYDAGFRRFGHGKNFIHIDIDPNKIPKMMWLYHEL